ncbi:MAG: tetratricopeptide repeat protein [Vicinamibacteria bacterium]
MSRGSPRAALVACCILYAVSFLCGAAHFVATHHRLPGIAIDAFLDAQEYLAEGKVGLAAREYRVGSRVAREYSVAQTATDLRARAGDPSGEIDQYLLGRELAPRDPGAYRGLGWAYARSGRVDEAIRSFRKALDVDPRDAKAWSAMGEVLLDHDQYAEALRAFRSAMALGRNDAGIHNSMGIALALQGQFPAAVSEFEEAVKRDPSPAFRSNLERARAGTL